MLALGCVKVDTYPSRHQGATLEQILDWRVQYWGPSLKHQFACLLDGLLSLVVVCVSTQLVVLNIGRCTYAVYVFLWNETLWARELPEVFDCS